MSDSCSLISESDYPLTNWIEESSDCLSEGNLKDKQLLS